MKRIKLSKNKAPPVHNPIDRWERQLNQTDILGQIQRWRRDQTSKRRNFFFCTKVNINKIRQTNTETIE